jgi:hypothetical protein
MKLSNIKQFLRPVETDTPEKEARDEKKVKVEISAEDARSYFKETITKNLNELKLLASEHISENIKKMKSDINALDICVIKKSWATKVLSKFQYINETKEKEDFVNDLHKLCCSDAKWLLDIQYVQDILDLLKTKEVVNQRNRNTERRHSKSLRQDKLRSVFHDKVIIDEIINPSIDGKRKTFRDENVIEALSSPPHTHLSADSFKTQYSKWLKTSEGHFSREYMSRLAIEASEEGEKGVEELYTSFLESITSKYPELPWSKGLQLKNQK